MPLSYPLITITILLTLSYYAYRFLQLHLTAKAFAKSHNCQSIPRVTRFDKIFLPLRFFQVSREIRKAEKAHKVLSWITDVLLQNGPTIDMSIFGGRRIWTCDPENVKAILASQFDDFVLGFREATFGPLLGKGIFDSDGEAWQHSRSLVRPAFTKSQVADLNLFESHLALFFKEIPHDGSTVDLAPLFFQLTADVAFEFLFGDGVDNITPAKKERRRQVGAAFDYAQSKLGDFGSYGIARYFFPFSKFNKSCKIVHEYVDEYVHAALAQTESSSVLKEKFTMQDEKARYVFLDELVRATRDPMQIRAELLNIMLAGRDTTASLLTTSFHVLARQPEVWSKLHKEVEALQGSLPDYNTLKDMRYLRYFLTECLRLYPVVPLNARTAVKNTTLPTGGGSSRKSPIFIPKGQRVLYSPWSMHRNPAIYGADASEFKPERWEEMRPGWHYLPFNGGPRICPGQQFALTEASYTIVRFLQTFKLIDNRDSEPWTENLALTVTSRNGARVGLYA